MLVLNLAVPLVGETTQRIFVTDSGLVFEGFAGLSPFSAAVPLDDITGVAFQSRRGRAPTISDEAALTLRGAGDTRIIPLSTDPAVLDPALLRRVVPAAVIEAWRDALARRGGRLPAGY